MASRAALLEFETASEIVVTAKEGLGHMSRNAGFGGWGRRPLTECNSQLDMLI